MAKSKSKLPKSWTTVTPLSRFLAMVLFVLFPFVGFYLGIQYQKMSTPSYPPPTYFSDPPIGDQPYPQAKAPMMDGKCTADVKQCPDKSWVHHSGPNCEFVCAK